MFANEFYVWTELLILGKDECVSVKIGEFFVSITLWGIFYKNIVAVSERNPPGIKRPVM